MKTPGFQHLSGVDQWQRCDFENLQLHLSTASVQLATREQVDGVTEGLRMADAEFHELRRLRGGAQLLCCPPDHCVDGYTLLADPATDLLWLAHDGWRSLAVPRIDSRDQAADPTRFANLTNAGDSRLFDQPASLSADPFGRLWLLERGAQRIRLLAADDLRQLALLTPPASAHFDDLAACGWGLVACDVDNAQLWRQDYGGEWEPVDSGSDERVPIAVSGHPQGPAVALLRATDTESLHGLLRLTDTGITSFEITDLDDPLHLLLAEPERLYIGEARAESQRTTVYHFSSYLLDAARLAVEAQWESRGFDGRGLFVGINCRVWATTAATARVLTPSTADRVSSGQVETFALDSGTIACQWHRVFIDACLPPGSELEVSVRCSDLLPARAVQRLPRPPHGLSELSSVDEEAVASAWLRRPLASRTPEDKEGWLSLGVLDRRIYQADVALPPVGRELPSEDQYGPREMAEVADNMLTLEGLIRNPPGRYLWLRIGLRGSSRRSPAVHAVRASHCRPSLLQHLPAYWSADSAVANEADRALALFEGLYTEFNQRIDQFHQLLDPRVAPPEALEWLGGFLAMVFDSRIGEPVRRQLLSELLTLYRQRGTPAGLERLCAILTEGRVAVVESFRLRRTSPSTLGAIGGGEASHLGSLQLGGGEADGLPMPGWESQLLSAHSRLLQRRDEIREQGATPCPPGELPAPLNRDPTISFYRQYAHRFSLVIFSPYEADLAAVVEAAVEAWKPAHTLHTLCWLDAGLVVGSNSYVGLGTSLGGGSRWQPALLGSAPLGRDSTLSRARPTHPSELRLDSSRLSNNECTPRAC
jgi:phage tail-like protein